MLRTKRMQVMLTEEEADAVKELAHAKRMSVSDFLRELVLEKIEQ